jgi:putative transposase
MMYKLLKTIFSALRTHRTLALENLALRQQLAILSRTMKRPRLTRTDRLFWVFLSRIWRDWAQVLVVVKPETVISWHRKGFKLFWRLKSRRRNRGRPRVAREIRDLIRRMSSENPLWGAPRIHGELLMLGIEVSPASVSKYMTRHRKPPSQTWRTFLRNHMGDMASIDFFTVPTATFRILYACIILNHARRLVVHFNITDSPSAAWTGQQVIEAFPWDTTPRYLLRDRDGKYGHEFVRRVRSLGIEEVKTAPRSPWQNCYVERFIGSIRRDCLDHVIVINEQHLRRILEEYFLYYHRSRTHLSLEKDCPERRAVELPKMGKVIALLQVGGLHHRYTRRAA